MTTESGGLLAVYPGTFDPVTNGHLDDLEVSQIKPWEIGFHRFLDEQCSDFLAELAEEKALSDELTEKLVKAIKDYSEDFAAQ